MLMLVYWNVQRSQGPKLVEASFQPQAHKKAVEARTVHPHLLYKHVHSITVKYSRLQSRNSI